MSIYQDVLEAQKLIDNCFDGKTGEILEEQEQAAIKLKEEVLTQGLEVLCKIRANYKADIESFKLEVERLIGRRKAIENRLNGLEAYIYDIHKLGGLDKTKAGTFTVSTRKSESVVLEDGFEDKDYGTYEFKANKKLIKDALKAGVEIQGAKLVVNDTLQIK